MLSVNDLRILAARDYQLCCKVDDDFPDAYAVAAAAYHIQQAIEKLLKALILLNGEQPAFTHNISKLVSHCEKLDVALPEPLDDIAEALTLWEVEIRYDPSFPVSVKKYEKSKAVYEALKQTIDGSLDS